MEKTVWRIIDANFNRAREALRVMEEFCRFSLNSRNFSFRVKQLRHELCGLVDKLDSDKLLAARESSGDVGSDLKVRNQMTRTYIIDSFTAAAKRLSEATRVLAEMTAVVDKQLPSGFEKIRFAGYTLEKDVILFVQPVMKFKNARLYVIIGNDTVELAEACIKGGADCLQLRLKNTSDSQFVTIACDFVKLCRDSGVISIINDRIDIAVLSDADGVHLGQNDLSITQAAKLAHKPMIWGNSTHNDRELTAAIEQQPTYIALGCVFPSKTKTGVEICGLDYIKRSIPKITEQGIVPLAIGGITAENVSQILNCGIKTICVSSAAVGSSDPQAACKALKDLL